jgi:hypothetical protein
MYRPLLVAFMLSAIIGFAAAQAPSDSGPIVVSQNGSEAAPIPLTSGMATFHLQEKMDAEPVKGAPFCATIVTEHTQSFADGNRIHTSDNSSLCRDSEGRTRREATLNLMGAAAQAAPPPMLITILDPVAGFRYMLDSENKIAHKISLAAELKMPGPRTPAEKGEQVMIYQRVGTAGPNMVLNDNVFFKRSGQISDEPAPTTENLGDQTINGVHTVGTRITTTIPAGKMGNEQPILVTSERWYSPELQATVMTKHEDPWAGELKTQFTNVNTSEPDASLFQVPADYKIVDEKAGPFVIQKRLLPSPPPAQ